MKKIKSKLSPRTIVGVVFCLAPLVLRSIIEVCSLCSCSISDIRLMSLYGRTNTHFTSNDDVFKCTLKATQFYFLPSFVCTAGVKYSIVKVLLQYVLRTSYILPRKYVLYLPRGVVLSAQLHYQLATVASSNKYYQYIHQK